MNQLIIANHVLYMFESIIFVCNWVSPENQQKERGQGVDGDDKSGNGKGRNGMIIKGK